MAMEYFLFAFNAVGAVSSAICAFIAIKNNHKDR